MTTGQITPPSKQSPHNLGRDQNHSDGSAKETLSAPSEFSFNDGMSATLSIHARLILVAVVLATLVLFGVGVVTDSSGLQGATATIFLLVELGIAPTLFIRQVSAMWFSLISVALSLCGTIAIGFVMALTHLWHPAIAMTIVAAGTGVMLAATVIRDLPQLTVGRARPMRRASRSSSAVVNVLSLLGLLLIVAVAAFSRSDPQQGGLFATINPAWYAGLSALIAAVVIAHARATSAAVPILMLSTIVVLSQSIVYGSPAVMSAARHVGIIDYVRVHQGVTPSLDIYQAWSGMFAGIAWLSDVGNIPDVMTVATWWPVLMSLALALAVAVLASRFLRNRFRIWFAAAVFALTSTLNIVYFSPQSLGLFLSITIISLAVGPRATSALRPRISRTRIGIIFTLSTVMAVSHQISPYLTVAALVAMLIFGYLRPWWLILLVLGPAVLWALANTAVLGHFISIGALGKLFSNVKPPTHSFTQLPIPAITASTFNIPAAVLLLTGLAAALTIVVIRRRFVWAIGLAALSPITLLAATDYGQEGIFRVTLFAGAWLAILVAGLPFSPTRFALPALTGSLVVLLGANVFGQTALDWSRVVTRDSAIATQTYERIAPDHSVLLMTGTGNATPQSISGRYLDVGYLSRENLGGYPSPLITYDPAADLARLTTNLVRYSPATGYYALVSTSIGAYDERYGFQSYADYQELAATMAVSPLWHPIRKGATSTLYEITNAGLALGGR